MLLQIDVIKLGNKNLININDYSAFTSNTMTIKEEKNNITSNINSLMESFNEEETINKLKFALKLKKVPYLTGYKLKLIENKYGFECDLPETESYKIKARFISLENNKGMYGQKDKFTFFGLECDIYNKEMKDSFTKSQCVFLVPKDIDVEKHIESFLSDVIYANYFNTNEERTFLIHERWIIEKYDYLPLMVVIDRVY